VTERPPYVRQIAAELELLSHGATTSFGASSSGVPAAVSRPVKASRRIWRSSLTGTAMAIRCWSAGTRS
jgi:hypothetical protein